MRLIDADALLAAFEKDISEQTKHMELLKSVGDMKHYYDISKVQIGMVSCRRMLENAPIIIDAVPVIRCKDCKYWHQEIYNNTEYFNFSSCDLNHHGDGRNFYCADGERKEE